RSMARSHPKRPPGGPPPRLRKFMAPRFHGSMVRWRDGTLRRHLRGPWAPTAQAMALRDHGSIVHMGAMAPKGERAPAARGAPTAQTMALRVHGSMVHRSGKTD